MEITSAALVVQICVMAVLVFAAVGDIRSFRIPNAIPLIIAALFVVYMPVATEPTNLLSHLASFVLAFVIGLFAFRYRIMAGGDVKLIAAIALWFSVGQLYILMTLIALAGGLQSVFIVLYHYASLGLRSLLVGAGGTVETGPPGDGSGLRGRRVPYGVAIAIGSIIALFLTLSQNGP